MTGGAGVGAAMALECAYTPKRTKRAMLTECTHEISSSSARTQKSI